MSDYNDTRREFCYEDEFAEMTETYDAEEVTEEELKTCTEIREANPADPVRLYLNEIAGFPLLSAEEERKLAEKIQNEHDDDARERLAVSNLRLVVAIAKRFTTSGVQLLDLIQSGNIALITAASKFDPAKNTRFSTYATTVITNELKKSAGQIKRTIAIPDNYNTALYKYKRFSAEYFKKFGCKPLPEESAKGLKMTVDMVNLLDTIASYEPVSLDAPVGDEGNTVLEDMLSDEKECDDERPASWLKNQLIDVLDMLTPFEKTVIERRLGITAAKPETVEEVASVLELPEDEIKRLEERALEKLSTPFAKKVLLSFLLIRARK